MKKQLKKLVKAYGKNEFDIVDIPTKVESSKYQRIIFGNIMGCSYCFPHGPETFNATAIKNKRNWKYYRNNQYR